MPASPEVADVKRPPLLEFHDVTVAYGRRPVLWNIDLTIDEPCLFGIIGPNGAGKSSLLTAALGLVPLAGGTVSFFGRPRSVAASAMCRSGKPSTGIFRSASAMSC